MSETPLEPGQRAVDRCDAISGPQFTSVEGNLSRPFLTPAHRSALIETRRWMEEAGLKTRLDPLGNLIGRLEGAEPGAPALLIGSHIDTVQNGGRYDGALGVMLGIECAHAIGQRGRRPWFAIEVIAFGDEEGSRFPASMMCSRGISEPLPADRLVLRDAAGQSLHDALAAFGLDSSQVGAAVRSPSEIVGYFEAHIEQGPVLEAENLPVGVVTGIAAQLRLKARFTGQAGHAGTSPMGLRRDALAGAAAAVLAVEQVCAEGPDDLRGTVGRFQSDTAAFNVISGSVEIGIDVRAASRPVRDRAAAEIEALCRRIAAERRLQLTFDVVQDLPDTPCDAGFGHMLADAVASLGLRPFSLVSGAGHDAMAVSALCPVAMLFIRCKDGVSHNPAEAVDSRDVAVAAQVMEGFVERLDAQFRKTRP